jgi:hypothetical protein
MAEVPIEEANKVDVSYCAVDSFGADGAAMMATQASKIINIFLKEHRWKFTRSTSATNTTALGTVNFSCGECEVPRPALVCS